VNYFLLLNYYVPSGTISFIIKKIEIKKDIGKIKEEYEIKGFPTLKYFYE